MPAEAISSSISNDPAKHSSYLNWHDIVQQQWQELFVRAAHLDRVEEVPSHLLCPLTMEVSSVWGGSRVHFLGHSGLQHFTARSAQ